MKGSDDEDHADNVDFNEQTMQDPQLYKGMKFTSADVFRKALQEWAIKRGYSYTLNKNNLERVSAICKDRCGFRIHASRLRDKNTFQIKTFKPVHSCPRVWNNNRISSKFLAEKYKEDLRDNPEWDVKAMQKKFQRDLGHEITISKCYRAKWRAKQLIYGDVIEQYRRLGDYAETLRVTNPGTLVKLETKLEKVIEDQEESSSLAPLPKEIVVFHYMYIRFGQQKQGYFSGLRPIVGLDGCHLKTSMGGQLLCAVGRDGNDNMFPLAMAIVDVEEKISWKWFLKLLFEDFGHPTETGWVFMFDQQKVMSSNKFL